MKTANNIYYLKKLRKKAYKKFKLKHFRHEKYYVIRVITDTIYFRESDYLSYDEGVEELKNIRREYILRIVDDMKHKRGRIVKGI